jgi:hypothetical protein
MATRQPIHNHSTATVRELHGHRYRYLGQLQYEGREAGPGLPADLFSGVGVRLYQDVDSQGQFLCIESFETGEEAWYRVDGARLLADGNEA